MDAGLDEYSWIRVPLPFARLQTMDSGSWQMKKKNEMYETSRLFFLLEIQMLVSIFFLPEAWGKISETCKIEGRRKINIFIYYYCEYF